MNNDWPYYKKFITVSLVAAAIAALLGVWGPLLYVYYRQLINSLLYSGYTIPGRIFLVNYPTASFIPLLVSFIISIVILVWSAKKRQTSALYWINGLSLAIIFSHLMMLAFIIIPTIN